MKNPTKLLGLAVVSSFLLVACGGGQASSDGVNAPPPPDSPDGTMRHVMDGILAHEPQRIWGALPETYQKDVSGLVHSFAGKLDVDIYDRGFVLLRRVGVLLEDKKDLFLASEMLPDEVDRDEMAANWDSVSGLIQTLASSDIARLETLATLDVGKFLATTGATLMQQAERAAAAAGQDLFEELRALEIELVETEGDRAILRMKDDDSAEDVEMTRVEGRWVPSDMAEAWTESMAEARAQLDEMSAEALQAMKPQILGMYGMIEGTLAQMEAAQTKEQFDEALQGIVFSVMGMMMGAAMQGM